MYKTIVEFKDFLLVQNFKKQPTMTKRQTVCTVEEFGGFNSLLYTLNKIHSFLD